VEWLTRPLTADGVVVAEPLDPARLTDANLRTICTRMHAILDTVEMPRCEGRLLPVKLFDAIDDLAGRVMHPGDHPPRLAEWAAVIREFGAYYELAGVGPIPVDPALWHRAAAWLGAAPEGAY
jgi:hypothetical protein